VALHHHGDAAGDFHVLDAALEAYPQALAVHVVRDGAEALEFIFCTGAYASRHFENPRLVLLAVYALALWKGGRM
jgi:hypothetical protein